MVAVLVSVVALSFVQPPDVEARLTALERGQSAVRADVEAMKADHARILDALKVVIAQTAPVRNVTAPAPAKALAPAAAGAAVAYPLGAVVGDQVCTQDGWRPVGQFAATSPAPAVTVTYATSPAPVAYGYTATGPVAYGAGECVNGQCGAAGYSAPARSGLFGRWRR